MSKHTAVTVAAELASKQLGDLTVSSPKLTGLWKAVEAHASRALDEAKLSNAGDFFLEVHANSRGVQAVAKVGDAIFKIER